MHRRVGASLTSEPIAIVGASCRLPGAPSLDALWPMLLAGTDAVSEIPDERWNKARLFHPERGQRGKAYTFAAGVIGDVSRFDPGFFGISPREAAQMDPQQRLLLELAYEAVEDAGLDLDRLAGEPVGVFVGGSSWDYLNLNISDPASTDAYSMIGATLCSLANRISYAFDFRGPSFTVDTACSSSLVALHQACEALRHGQVDMALVGGVSLLLAPQSFVGFCAASMLSPTGRCHAFDSRADGYVRAEGGGIVMLKPLGAALAAGDPIRAVIRGTGVNSDGRTTGLSLPNREAQAALLSEVYTGFGLDPEALAYVEAHGTGTPAGDPIEAGALGEVLGRARSRPLTIGSIKTNIGHLEAGSGMAGLIKAMLVAERRIIPPSLHVETPNPHIPFDELNLRLAREAMPIDTADGVPALVAVNSFGFGGTNAHAVLEGPDQLPSGASAAASPVEPEALPPLLLSARSEEALKALALTWRDRLASGDAVELPAAMRGAALHRTPLTRRLAVPAGAPEEMAAALDAFARGKPTTAVATNVAVKGALVFAFSGNGSQWAGMAADAVANSAAFRAALAEVDEALAPWLGWSVADRLAEADAEALRHTEVAQPLLFAVQVATVLALREHGVEPALVLGHSVGEVAAAWTAGALDLDEAARVIAARSRAQQSLHGVGAMAVLGLGPVEAAKALAGDDLADAGVELAAHNSSAATTVAGSVEAIDRLEAASAAHGWRFTRLDLDYAFHSAVMDPIGEQLVAELKGLAPGCTRLPFVSTVTGLIAPGEALDAGYWWRNVREPVLFTNAAREAVARGGRIFVEVGPHAVVQAYLADALRIEEKDGRVLPSLSRRAQRGDPIATLAARIHAAGGDIRHTEAFAGPAAVRGLPRYPWQRERFWVEPSEEIADDPRTPFDHPLIGRRNGSDPNLWERHVGLELLPWIADHAVGGAAVVPAAALIDAALAAARARWPAAPGVDLLDVEIGRALVIEAHHLRDVRFRIANAAGDFELASRPRLSGEPWTVHMTGRLAPSEATSAASAAGPIDASPDIVCQVRAPALYALASKLGLDYGPNFQVVSQIDVTGEADAIVRFEGEALAGKFVLPPNRVDGALQGLLALAADRLGSDAGVLPWRFGRVRLYAAGVPYAARLRVTRVGPRSVRADIALLGEADNLLAEMSDCWFVRVALGRRPRADEMFFHTVQVMDKAAPDAPADPLPEHAPEPNADMAAPDSRLLADAFATAAAMEALRPLTDAATGRLVPQRLLGEGVIAAESRALLDRLLRWLAADGVATQAEDGSWSFQADLPPADAILRTLFFDLPRGVADVALMSLAAEALPTILHDGADRMPALPAALWDQLLLDSPASARAAEALADAVAQAVRRAGGAPLRILEVGARQGAFTRRLRRALGDMPARLVAATTAADLPSLRSATDLLPQTQAIAWIPGDSYTGEPFDLVVGLFPIALDNWRGAELGQLAALLRDGGSLLLAEPAPNRTWQLLRPGAAPPIDLRRLSTSLEAAGFAQLACQPLPTEIWPVEIVSARFSAAEEAAPAAPATVTLIADDGVLGVAIAAQLQGAGVDLTRAALASLDDDGADKVQGAVAILLDGIDIGLPDRLARLATLALRTDERALAVTLLVVGEVAGDTAGAALMGVRRVLANEAAQITVRMVRLDPALDTEAAAAIAAREILVPDAEQEISWTPAGRTTTRVRRGLPVPAEQMPAPLRLSIERPGLLDSLGWGRTVIKQPGSGEIAIAVEASGLNFRDVMWSMGLLPDEALLDGFAGPTLGLECAGTVTAVGADVTGFAPGDRVMAFAPAALATHTVTKAHAAMRMPPAMSFAEAATIPVAFLTVAYALGTLAQVAEGETVLIHGGAGGVGLAAIQYARARGARVFVTAGSPAKRALLRSLDLDAVLDSRSLAFADEVMALTDGQGVDVVLNSLAGEAMRRSLGVVKPFGRFLELGKRDFYENSAVGLRPFRHNVSYFGIDADQLPVKRPQLAAALFAELGRLFASGELRPLPYRLFDFADVEDAFRLMQASGHVGKIVLAPGAALPVPLAQPQPFALRADRAYLVTGGLDGFGRETARWLARVGARHLALLSRRGPATPGADAFLAELAELGVDARAYAADVADEAALAPVLDAIRTDQAPIAGVVHAAVAMDDALLRQLDAERFARALAPKLDGAEALDRLTRADPIELFLLFSSVTTPLGNPGQGNYVAANAAIEALAERRHAAGLPALAVQWGPIGDAGYLTREAQVSELLARQLGHAHLTAAEALDAVPTLLGAGLPVAGMATVRWGALRSRLPLLGSTLFAEMGEAVLEEAGEIDLRAILAECTPDEARDRVTTLLVEEVARIMKLAADRIEPNRPLAELGMDSLMAVELRLAVEQRFGITVPLLALSEGATLAAMAGRIVRGLGDPAAEQDEAASLDAQIVARIQQHEGQDLTAAHGPADGAEAPVEPGFAAAAATSP